MKFFEKHKNTFISHFMAFVTLTVMSAISLHFAPEAYKYTPFYIAGLFQETTANYIKQKLLTKKK